MLNIFSHIVCLQIINIAFTLSGQGIFDQIAGHPIIGVHKNVHDRAGKKLYINYTEVIFEAQPHIFWFGSFFGLYKFDEKLNLWTDFRSQKEQIFFESVKAICQDLSGKIWLKSSRSQLRYFDGRKWNKPNMVLGTIPIEKSHTIVTGIDGRLWFITNFGIISYDGQTFAAPIIPSIDVEKKYAEIPIKYRNQAEKNWAVVSAQIDEKHSPVSPLNTKERDSATLNSSALLSAISCRQQDRDGIIWFGTRKAILNYCPETGKWNIYPLPTNLIEVTLIYEDRRGQLWFADNNGHLAVYNLKDKYWKSYDLTVYFPQIQPQSITSIYQDRAGIIMIGTNEGLIIFNEKDGIWKMVGNQKELFPIYKELFPIYNVGTIFEDSKSRIWISTNNGIIVLAP